MEPSGLDGLPAPGEADNLNQIAYGIPDVKGARRATCTGRHTRVTWAGHSAGLRPDLAPLRKVRLARDPIVEAPLALAPMIDPNLHSCGTEPPQGMMELQHPEKDFYIVGMKSYGRWPTFLMATGYQQVRSVVAELAGDAQGRARGPPSVAGDWRLFGPIACALVLLRLRTRPPAQACRQTLTAE